MSHCHREGINHPHGGWLIQPRVLSFEEYQRCDTHGLFDKCPTCWYTVAAISPKKLLDFRCNDVTIPDKSWPLGSCGKRGGEERSWNSDSWISRNGRAWNNSSTRKEGVVFLFLITLRVVRVNKQACLNSPLVLQPKYFPLYRARIVKSSFLLDFVEKKEERKIGGKGIDKKGNPFRLDRSYG